MAIMTTRAIKLCSESVNMLT